MRVIANDVIFLLVGPQMVMSCRERKKKKRVTCSLISQRRPNNRADTIVREVLNSVTEKLPTSMVDGLKLTMFKSFK